MLPTKVISVRLSGVLSAQFCKHISAKKTKQIVIAKKRNKELMQLKAQLAKKQPIKSQSLYQQFHYRDVYKRMSIEMESFFFDRPYSVTNFNFLLNLIAEQHPPDYQNRIQEVVRKMGLLGMAADQKSYNYMIKAAGNAKEPVQAEKYFEEACKKFLPNKFFYTSLMQNYANNNDPNQALKLLDEMKELGMEPDLPTFTTLANCFRKGRRLDKCWEIHKRMKESNVEPDETYTGVMLKVFAATHDAEKAINIYKQNITDKGIKPMIETVNAYFKALSCRRDYSAVVIDKFFSMTERGQIVNSETVNWAIRACATTGNVKSAGQILKFAKIKEIQIEVPTLSTLLRVYASACSVPDQEEELREVMITDCWKLLQAIQAKGGVNTSVLNNMLSIYANSISHEQIEGLILPLYAKFGQEYNMYTYEILIKMYYKLRQFSTAMRIWHQMNHKITENSEKMLTNYSPEVKHLQKKAEHLNENLRPTFTALHCYLDIGIRMMDMNQVLDALSLFKKMNRTPKNATLKFLGNLKNLPEEIQVSLMEFKIQFGKAKLSKKPLPNIDDPQNK